jgi:hypothetical protein
MLTGLLMLIWDLIGQRHIARFVPHSASVTHLPVKGKPAERAESCVRMRSDNREH